MRTPFTPREVIFAPTAQCNLNCGHCRVDRARGTGANRLTESAALTFLEDCAGHGIDRVGFSGGEPFLEIGFIEAIVAKSVELGLYFDRLMTNGVWWKDRGELDAALERVIGAGFDGTLAVSVDNWHAQDPARVAEFFLASGAIAGRNDFFEIVSVLDHDGKAPLGQLEALARGLSAELISESGTPVAIRDAQYSRNRDRNMEDGSGINIPVIAIPLSPSQGDASGWSKSRWFTDDWCEGPGQVFYVHPDGLVAVCCGFANESAELIAGHVSEGYETLLDTARRKPHIRDCYERGLKARKDELEKSGVTFPGKTDDICFFCEYLCRNGLANGN